MDPGDAEVFFEAGLAYKQLRNYGRAAELFRKVTRMAPSHTAVYTQLAAVSAMHFLDRVTPAGSDEAEEDQE